MLHFNDQLENRLHEEMHFTKNLIILEAISSSVQLFQTIKVFNQRSDVNFIIKNKSSIEAASKNKY